MLVVTVVVMIGVAGTIRVSDLSGSIQDDRAQDQGRCAGTALFLWGTRGHACALVARQMARQARVLVRHAGAGHGLDQLQHFLP